jgi:lipoyl(octanoyl) transferase
MAINSLYNGYFQKSKVFLYPILGIKKGSSVVPTQTFLSWGEEISPEDMKLVCLYTTRNDSNYINFENHFLLNEKTLALYNATYYKINRGGDITYHGPGQLVVYPILDLDYFFSDIHKYLRYLEEAVIQTIATYGVVGERMDGLTGVWIESNTPRERKICAFGVKCSRWVTMHGIGFNINTDLTYFNHIIPCGIEDKSVTSLQKELGRPVDIEEVSSILKEKLASLFGFNYV